MHTIELAPIIGGGANDVRVRIRSASGTLVSSNLLWCDRVRILETDRDDAAVVLDIDVAKLGKLMQRVGAVMGLAVDFKEMEDATRDQPTA